MCHYKYTTFSCGCQIGENTLVCGYVNDDLAQCMADTRADEVSVPKVCGRQCCKSAPSRESNLKTQDSRKINHSDGEWPERSVETPEL
ncbi:hypothetical protein B9Z19DRAFT_980547 [Tuber borchii]|uniref:Uncharacterized protein n=1 Tax=Tuber borchii TaxID=42251 RepID=A0A2T6ZUF4_TUBBO|nr:hypothetical protein B9Z19DRAFT_980547 [Tuber borchii]